MGCKNCYLPQCTVLNCFGYQQEKTVLIQNGEKLWYIQKQYSIYHQCFHGNL